MVDLMDLALAIVESAGRPEVFNTPVRLIAGRTASTLYLMFSFSV
jgi:hypothetical protein